MSSSSERVWRNGYLLALLLLCQATAAIAQEGFVAVTLDASADDEEGSGYALALDYGPNDDALLYVNVSRSTSAQFDVDLETRGLAAGGSRRFGNWGLGLDLDGWRDDEDFESRRLALALEWYPGNWTLTLRPGRRTLESPVFDPRTLQSTTERFEGRSLALDVAYDGGGWRLYAGGARHEYSPDPGAFDTATLTAELERLGQLELVRFLILTGQEDELRRLIVENELFGLARLLNTYGLEGLNRLITYQTRRVIYLSSMQTLASGLADPRYHVGVEWAAGDGTLGLDYAESRLPVDGIDARTLTLRWRVPVGEAWEFGMQAGSTRTDTSGTVNFAGLSLTWYL